MEEKTRYSKITEVINNNFNAINVRKPTLVSPPSNQPFLTVEQVTPVHLPHLLLIEDNIVALKILETIVGRLAYRFSSVPNAEEALKLFKAIEFDLIITDIGLPGMSGLELIREVRELEQTTNKKPVSIIALSAHASKQTETECREAGIDQFFIKPVPPDILQAVIADSIAA